MGRVVDVVVVSTLGVLGFRSACAYRKTHFRLFVDGYPLGTKEVA